MRILVTDDDDDNMRLVTRFLVRAGHEVLAARTGRQAVEIAGAARPHLVLMDITLPDISGLDAARRIKNDKATAATPIVAITAHALPGDRARCLEAGCSDYVSKPIDFKALAEVIQRFGAAG